MIGLCEVLDDSQTRYPGPDLTLVYEPPRAEMVEMTQSEVAARAP